MAEYLEGGLPPEHRQWLEEHLAACADCCTTFADSSLVLHQERRHELRRLAGDYPRLGRSAAGAGLLVAALTGLVLGSGLPHTPPTPPRLDPRAELVAAAGPLRPVLPRLTGGFRWAPAVPTSALRRSGRRGPATTAAAPGILSYLAANPSIRLARSVPGAVDLGAAGAAQLLAGDMDAGVESLIRASAGAPESALLLSDLGAALLARGVLGDDGEDLPAGLEAIEHALAASPHLPEALFNRALALEELHLPLTAQEAWRAYLAVDASSPWAAEARQRLHAIESPLPPDAAALRTELAAAGAAQDGDRVAMLVADQRSLARQLVEEQLLPGWGAAWMADDAGEADRQLTAARTIAEEWEAQTADATLRAAVAEVERAAGRRRERLAGAYRALGEGSRQLALTHVAEAQAALEQAVATFPPGSPATAWARMLRVVSVFYQGGDVEAAAGPLSQAAELDPATRGRLLGILGLYRANRGNLMGQLALYRDALAIYERLEESDGITWLHFLIGETYGYLGQSGRAWGELGAALAPASQLVNRERAFQTLLGSAMLAVSEGRPRVAAALLDELLAQPGFDRPEQKALLYVERGRVRLTLEDAAGARSDVQRAAAWVATADPAIRRYLAGDLQMAEGLLAPQPTRAIALFSQAVASFRASGRQWRLPGVLLERAQAHLRAGELVLADADLEQGLILLAEQSPATGGAALRAERQDAPDRLFDERVRLALRRERPGQAFEVAEAGRARTLRLAAAGHVGGAADSAPLSSAALRAGLPRDTTLLFYSVLRDRVVSWRITRDRVAFLPLGVTPAELAQLASAFSADLAYGVWTPSTRGFALRLYAALLSPARLDAGGPLVIVPDEELHGVAFAALVNPESGRFLIEEREVGLAPSAELYLRARARWRSFGPSLPRDVAVVGDPQVDGFLFRGLDPLPGARQEARQVASLYPRRELLLGSAATRAAFLAAAARREVLHFAGHTVISRVDPGRSSLPLAQGVRAEDGVLLAEDIAAMNLTSTRTVVLSACDSGSGRRIPGEGPLSLARAFLAAGAPSVVSSLWSVDDSAGPLVRVLHEGLRRGEQPSAALRAAQLALLRGEVQSLRSPAVWAAFQALGG